MPREPSVPLSRRSSRSPPGADPCSPYRHAGRSGKGKDRHNSQQPTHSAPNSKPREQPPAKNKDVGADKWPLEYFPPPPIDGHWMSKNGARIVNKIPPKPTGLPPLPSPTLRPPVMSFSYPPLAPLREDDPAWLPKMAADVERQRKHVETQLALAHAEATSAFAEVTLAHSELENQMGLMQKFLDHVAHIAGNGFVRRMLRDVDDMMARRTHPDDDESSSDDAEDELERNEVEDVVTDDSGDENEGGQTEDIVREENRGRADEEERKQEHREERESQLILRTMEGPPAIRCGSPVIDTNPLAVGRRRGRPLRRDPYRIREDAFGDPVLYEVVD